MTAEIHKLEVVHIVCQVDYMYHPRVLSPLVRFVTSMVARRTHLFLVSSSLLKKNAFISEEMTSNLAKLKSNPF